MTYGGVLEPLLHTVEQTAPTGAGRLAGQHVVTPRQDVAVLIAVDGEQNVHFLVAPVAADISRFARFNLKALSVARKEWSIGGAPTQQYLDLTCSGGTQAAYRRPFLAFCEDLLVDLERPGIMPDDAAYRTCVRWRRFWSADDGSTVTVEWVRGQLGELLFLEALIGRLGAGAVKVWTGPARHDHDFQAMSRVAFEVKVASSIPYVVECNLNQLDSTLFEELYLVCYHASRAEAGESISDVVARIESSLREDEEALDLFSAALHTAGYRRQRRTDYDNFRFAVDGPHLYLVDEEFPRITSSSFAVPPDARIRGVRYRLQLVGLETLRLSSPRVNAAISRLL